MCNVSSLCAWSWAAGQAARSCHELLTRPRHNLLGQNDIMLPTSTRPASDNYQPQYPPSWILGQGLQALFKSRCSTCPTGRETTVLT